MGTDRKIKNIETQINNKIKNSQKKTKKEKKAPVKKHTRKNTDHYIHAQKRKNNPESGHKAKISNSRNAETETYSYDPNLDPKLQWAEKIDSGDIKIPTVPLYIHEKIDPKLLARNLKKQDSQEQSTLDFFNENSLKLDEISAVQFYQYEYGWSNRLILGDSKLIMNSLLKKEKMAQKVQMIYLDPPYGIRFNSNFQNLVSNSREDEVSTDPQMIRAFRDTWELHIHSYLTYLRDRLLIAYDLLKDSGSVFVQISSDNVHLVRVLLDEIFGYDNFVRQIKFRTTSNTVETGIETIHDYIIWYAKNKQNMKLHQIYQDKYVTGKKELQPLYNKGYRKTRSVTYVIRGEKVPCKENSYWRHSNEVINALDKINRIERSDRGNYSFIKYDTDFPYTKYNDVWSDTWSPELSEKLYVVQTQNKVVERCIMMTTDPGDLILDPTCGGGTTAQSAEKLGRRWITCDTSRIAISLARIRLMSSVYEYYKLKSEELGIKAGFIYKKIDKITIKSLANEEPKKSITIYHEMDIDKSKMRVSGPFTVEAATPPNVLNIDRDKIENNQSYLLDWIEGIRNNGIKNRNNTMKFLSLSLDLENTLIHARGELIDNQSVAISFGPQYHPFSKLQAEEVLEAIDKLKDKPKILLFISNQFDPEVANILTERNESKLAVYMADIDKDFLVADLRKSTKSNKNIQSFWIIGQPNITISCTEKQYTVTINGFDYVDPVNNEYQSGNTDKIAMWMIDTDYDGKSIHPDQIYFPNIGTKISKRWKNFLSEINGELNPEVLEPFYRTKSIPFKTNGKKIAIKIIDDAGVESVRVLKI